MADSADKKETREDEPAVLTVGRPDSVYARPNRKRPCAADELSVVVDCAITVCNYVRAIESAGHSDDEVLEDVLTSLRAVRAWLRGDR